MIKSQITKLLEPVLVECWSEPKGEYPFVQTIKTEDNLSASNECTETKLFSEWKR